MKMLFEFILDPGENQAYYFLDILGGALVLLGRRRGRRITVLLGRIYWDQFATRAGIL